MKSLIFSIYDTATETFMTPIFCKTEAEALRVFNDAANNPDNPIGAHPADYHLYQVGEFTDHNGDLRNQAPTCIISAIECTQTNKEK